LRGSPIQESLENLGGGSPKSKKEINKLQRCGEELGKKKKGIRAIEGDILSGSVCMPSKTGKKNMKRTGGR